MISKEALEKLSYIPIYEEDIDIIFKGDLCEVYRNEVDIISKDLDRLEKLEKENQELKDRYKHRAETSNDLCKAVKQYEKAIEIFRKMCSLNNNKTLETEECFLRLTEEEYSLLKEVL